MVKFNIKGMLKYNSITLASLFLIFSMSCTKEDMDEPRNDDSIVLNHNDSLPKSFDEAMSSAELLIGGKQIIFKISDKEGISRYVLEGADTYWVSGNGGDIILSFDQYFDASDEYGKSYLSAIVETDENDEDSAVTYQVVDNDLKMIPSSVCKIESFVQSNKEVDLKIKFPENKQEYRRKIKFVFSYWTNSNDEFYPYEQPYLTYNEISFVQLP